MCYKWLHCFPQPTRRWWVLNTAQQQPTAGAGSSLHLSSPLRGFPQLSRSMRRLHYCVFWDPQVRLGSRLLAWLPTESDCTAWIVLFYNTYRWTWPTPPPGWCCGWCWCCCCCCCRCQPSLFVVTGTDHQANNSLAKEGDSFIEILWREEKIISCNSVFLFRRSNCVSRSPSGLIYIFILYIIYIYLVALASLMQYH